MYNQNDRHILRLALPSILQNVTVPLLGLCDVAIMGHVGGAAHIGAIAVGSMVFNVVYWLFGFLRMSTSGLTSQALGARRLDETTALLTRSLLIGLAFGLLFIIAQRPVGWIAFALMQPTADVARLCTPYYNICVWGAPAMLGLYSLSGWFIGMQNTRLPMLVAIFQNVVNIAVSLLLVVGFGWDIQGVAVGTVVAQWSGLLFGLLLLRRYYGRHLRKPISLHTPHSSLHTPHSSLHDYFRLNADIFLRTLCMVAVNLYFTSAGAAQGAAVLAANTLLMQLFMLFSYVMDGFAFAGEALSGKLYGAADPDGLRRMVRRLFRWGWGVAALFTMAYLVGGSAFLGLLTTDEGVVCVASGYLLWAVLIPFTGMGAFLWDGIFIGLTRSRGMLLSCLLASIAFFALWLSLCRPLGNHALWLALIVYLAVRSIVQTVLFHASSRKL